MLATNMFFWDWLGAPIQPPAPLAAPPASPGPWGTAAKDSSYHPLPDEYWQHREAKMTQDRKTPSEIFFDPAQVISKTPANGSGIAGIEERKALLSAMTSAGSVDDLKAIASRLRTLRKPT